jgi:hypothetical protein
MNLIVTLHGDESVGIWSAVFIIECPFEKEDIEPEDLEFFRNKIKELYEQYNDMGIRAEYDFEQRREVEEEIELGERLAAIGEEYDGRDYDNEAKQYQDDLRESEAPTPYDP